MNNFVFISVYIDKNLFSNLIETNKYIVNSANIKIYGVDNRDENIGISKRYNQFLESYDYACPAWLIFCHSDWEIRADIADYAQNLNKNTIYGPIGTILHKKDDGTFVREYRGQCAEKKRDGSGERLLLCKSAKTGDVVDTVDCQCLMVHSSLVARYNWRFDEYLNFNLYTEDFCIAAKKYYGIQTKIINIPCCHWNQVETMDGREDYYSDLRYLDKKYPNDLFSGNVSLIGSHSILVSCSNVVPKIIVHKE